MGKDKGDAERETKKVMNKHKEWTSKPLTDDDVKTAQEILRDYGGKRDKN